MSSMVSHEKEGNVQSKEQFFENFKESPELLKMAKYLYTKPLDVLKAAEDKKRDELLETDKNSETYDEKLTKATIISLVIKNKIDNEENE